ncbi:MAG: hypothetical protein P4M05_25245 [Bradyrhizobium sp.]|nr:hypothetical protein [Bradyrhizobium sp.]
MKAPDSEDPRAAAMTNPASIALHAIWKASLTAGQRGSVVGCGLIGPFRHPVMRLLGAFERKLEDD